MAQARSLMHILEKDASLAVHGSLKIPDLTASACGCFIRFIRVCTRELAHARIAYSELEACKRLHSSPGMHNGL